MKDVLVCILYDGRFISLLLLSLLLTLFSGKVEFSGRLIHRLCKLFIPYSLNCSVLGLQLAVDFCSLHLFSMVHCTRALRRYKLFLGNFWVLLLNGAFDLP